ncbi:hypothetical protein Zmor_014999 [Zophobas morio]|uniref:Retrovirus-related Pol polyprotein from transposon TNT 1-94 n=1 Tax=Zophobas morio TaxID=2755281 RepID=A0AA38IIF4_9CUCU|nr:hypothetical protein Zmor_014999 [Zophobas morio]
MLAEGPIPWDSRKQKTVALSSTEAEYMALTEAAKEATFIQKFLLELGFAQLSQMVLFSDNQGALRLAQYPVYHARSKHIDLRHHYIREVVKNDSLTIQHVPSQDMIGDIFTKGLASIKHGSFTERLDLAQPRVEGKC